MKLAFSAGTVHEDTLYFSDNYCNALMKLDLNTGNVDHIGEFPNEDSENQTCLHIQCIKQGNIVYFIPCMAHNIHIFELNTGNIRFVSIARSSETKFLFSGAVLKDDFLWVFPANLEQRIIRMDINSLEVELLQNFQLFINGIMSNQAQAFWKWCEMGGNVYLALFKTNKIIKYNMTTQKVNIIDTEVENIDSIYEVNNDLWICTLGMGVFLWSPETNKVHKSKLKFTCEVVDACMIVESAAGEVYLVPNYGRELLRKKKDENVFINEESLTINNKLLDIRRVNFGNYTIWKNKVILFPGLGGNIVVIENRAVVEIEATMIGDYELYKRKYIGLIRAEACKGQLVEGRPYMLDEYISAIVDY